MTSLLVVGASSGIGLETVRRALSVGHRVRAFARRADAIAIEDAGLEKIVGDARAPADIDKALSGVEVVIETLGVSVGPREMLSGTDLFSKSTRVLVDAMARAGVKRLIAVTGLGAGDSRGHGGILYDNVMFPLVLKRVYEDKDIQEMIIRRSGLAWTIVRPGILTAGPATGAYRVLVEREDWRGGAISRADVADFLIRAAESEAYLGKTPVLVG